MYRFHSSGRWFFGSHWPNSSRNENTRSLARAFSSSRRAPPKTASKRCSAIASSSVTVCSRLRLARGRSPRPPGRGRSTSWTLATISRTPSSATRRSRILEDLGEVVAGVHVHDRKRDRRRRERLLGQREHDDRVLAAGEQQHGPLELGRDLAEDVDRLGLEHVELRERVVGAHAAAPAGRRDQDPSGLRSLSSSRLRSGPAADQDIRQARSA